MLCRIMYCDLSGGAANDVDFRNRAAAAPRNGLFIGRCEFTRSQASPQSVNHHVSPTQQSLEDGKAIRAVIGHVNPSFGLSLCPH